MITLILLAQKPPPVEQASDMAWCLPWGLLLLILFVAWEAFLLGARR